MKWKRLMLLILVFSMVGAVTVFADDAFEWYQGKKVKVIVNDTQLKSPGLLIDGTTMLPAREVAENLQAMVRWNGSTQTVTIDKPNVHISLLQEFKNGSFGTFGQVIHKNKYDFHIFTQIDSLKTELYSYKITIVDPYGNTQYTYEDELKQQKENLWIGTPNINLEFKHIGKYTVKFFMKTDAKGDYSLVSEKVFPSIAN